jgi:hypothetical protein
MVNKRNSQKRLWLNCRADLQRAAVALYLNPRGRTHQVFLGHAGEILKKINNRRSRYFNEEISKYSKQADSFANKKEIINLADKILTLGVMMP